MSVVLKEGNTELNENPAFVWVSITPCCQRQLSGRHGRDTAGHRPTAYRAGNFEVFEKNLKAGADVNMVRRDGTSVLQLVIVSRQCSDTKMDAQDD